MYDKNLKKIKKLLGKTTEQLAQSIDMPSRTLGGYERKERVPSIELPMKLIERYCINANWFLSGIGCTFIQKNTLKRQETYDIHNRVNMFAKRLKEIQSKNSLLDSDMAQIIGISENLYMCLCSGKEEPSLKIINKIKENFDVDIDWLLYGYNDKTYTGDGDNSNIPKLTPEQYQKLLKLLDENS